MSGSSVFVPLYVMTVLILGGILLSRPHEMLRPSFWFCIFMLATISPAAAFTGPALDRGLENAWVLRMGALTFPLAVAVWIALTPRLSSTTRALYRTCRLHPAPEFDASDKAVTVAIASLSAGMVAVYLATVPLESLGLVVMFTDPEHSALARERTLKLLSSPLAKYSYTFHRDAFALVLVGLAALWRPRRAVLRAGLWGVAVPLLFLSVMLTGARSQAARLVLVLGLLYLLRQGILRRGFVLPLAAAAGVLVVTVLTIARNGLLPDLSLDEITHFMSTAIFKRLFVAPFSDGVLTNLYAQEHGLLGVSGVRLLALLWGVEHVNVPNVVALTYMKNAMASSSANTCFLFDFQACFGLLPGWILSVVLLCGLDHLLYLFRSLKASLLPAFLAALLVATLSLLSSAYTVSLLSHGILPVTALAVGSRLLRVRSQNPSFGSRVVCLPRGSVRRPLVAGGAS